MNRSLLLPVSVVLEGTPRDNAFDVQTRLWPLGPWVSSARSEQAPQPSSPLATNT